MLLLPLIPNPSPEILAMKKSLLSASLAVALGFVLGPATSPAADIEITTFGSQGALESAIGSALSGPGISIFDVSYSGALVASGTFTNGLSTGIGIDTGIVLTSGLALNISNSNTYDDITGDNGLPGLPALTALIPGYETYDATSVTIGFESDGGDLYFNYVFGSDEYSEWVGSPFNDVFGFFVDGVNIALVPGTLSTPVSINNVNAGYLPYSIPSVNPQYYRDNPYAGGTYNFEYDGFTKVLTAYARGLGSGTHYITLAIADAGDWVLDSGVFLQAGTFSDQEMEDDEGDDPDDGGYDFSHGVPDGGSTLGLLLLALGGLVAAVRRVSART